MNKEKDEIIQVNENTFTIIKCKECSGKFWSKQSYILHWSCNGKLRCSYCFEFGHINTNCDLRIECDKRNIKSIIK